MLPLLKIKSFGHVLENHENQRGFGTLFAIEEPCDKFVGKFVVDKTPP